MSYGSTDVIQELRAQRAALLAVAKAADRAASKHSNFMPDSIIVALQALDAAHPGWREWTA